MTIAFKELPKTTQRKLIETFGLPQDEDTVLRLRYLEELSYSRIAAQMHIAESSVGPLLTKSRKHVVQIANECYELAPDEVKKAIDLVGWREIEWPIIYNRNKG